METIYLWPDQPALSILVLWLISTIVLWAARTPVLQLLGELGPEERKEMVLARFVDPQEAGPLAEQILYRTGGNPYYIEALMQSLVEQGVCIPDIQDPQQRLRWTRQDTQLQIPASVESLVSSRLDRLPPDVREVLRQAPAGFSAATKCFCTEHEQRVAGFVARTLGPDAMMWDEVGRGLAYDPAYTIMGGTSNIMRNILGERVLGLPREPR